ncbi:MAG: recombinase family protein [Neisseriaceae bacterium]|nr:recombinase family protein [Neisseriaceae bacterium]MBQ9725360.1 recombinase family protein [Neisseriaceae bacterium]
MKVGYIRVSTGMQNTARQLDGIQLGKTFIDHASGKSTKRPKLTECLSFLREGDTLVVHSMDRLARNLIDLRNIVEMLTEKGVAVQFVKENLTFDGKSDNYISTLTLSIMGAFAEFERNVIRERQREGIIAAQKNGVHFGRPKKLTKEISQQIDKLVSEGKKNKTAIAKELGIGKTTLYRHLSQ